MSREPAERPIPVLEIFGPTVQGEGMSIGRKTMFVRTSGCDYRCSWCDSAFTWDGSGREDLVLLRPEEIWRRLEELGGGGFDHVTLSGGNPLLLPQLEGLVRLLRERQIRIAVETQGSVWQDWALAVDEVTVSPKPPSSGMETDLKLLDQWMERLSAAAASPSEAACPPPDKRSGSALQFSLKIVIFDEADLEYAGFLHRRYPQVPLILQTGNPVTAGETASQSAVRLLAAYEGLIDSVISRSDMPDVRILPQLHTLVWGNKRGV